MWYKFAQSQENIQNIINKKILGDEFDPLHWECPMNEQGDAIGVPVSPFMYTPKNLVIKNKNIFGGKAIQSPINTK